MSWLQNEHTFYTVVSVNMRNCSVYILSNTQICELRPTGIFLHIIVLLVFYVVFMGIAVSLDSLITTYA